MLPLVLWRSLPQESVKFLTFHFWCSRQGADLENCSRWPQKAEGLSRTGAHDISLYPLRRKVNGPEKAAGLSIFSLGKWCGSVNNITLFWNPNLDKFFWLEIGESGWFWKKKRKMKSLVVCKPPVGGPGSFWGTSCVRFLHIFCLSMISRLACSVCTKILP